MSGITIYEEIRSLIRQGYTNRQIQDKLLGITMGQIAYQRRKIKNENRDEINKIRERFLKEVL